ERAPAAIAEEAAVARIALVESHLARAEADPAHPPGDGAKRALRQGEEDRGALQRGEPGHHVLIRRPAVVGPPLQHGLTEYRPRRCEHGPSRLRHRHLLA